MKDFLAEGRGEKKISRKVSTKMKAKKRFIQMPDKGKRPKIPKFTRKEEKEKF